VGGQSVQRSILGVSLLDRCECLFPILWVEMEIRLQKNRNGLGCWSAVLRIWFPGAAVLDFYGGKLKKLL
jgi:hypothetical protein